MVYFPEEVFRNIASYLVDPYKKDKEEHAKMWQRIRVQRQRRTLINIEDDYSYTIIEQHDRYFVRTIPSSTSNILSFRPRYDSSEIDTVFYLDDHTRRLENVFETIKYSHESGDPDYDDYSDVEHELVDDY